MKKGKRSMDNVLGISRYIVKKKGKMGFFSLHKWLYLCYAFLLVIDGKPFNEKFYAWANGPAMPDLYKLHKGNFKKVTVGWFKGRKYSKISRSWKDVIDQVLKVYSRYYNKTSEWGVSQLFHYELTYYLDTGCALEPPWKQAREGLGILDRGKRPIKDINTRRYYSQLIGG